MPIIRKVIRVGGSRAVSIPSSWLDYAEKANKVRISKVSMEVNGVLIIAPFIEKGSAVAGADSQPTPATTSEPSPEGKAH